ncbi:hypothetical protein D322_3206 [Yersinia enterocolitica IP 10393]|uniref:Uncharacterized protein n=1 Tax=Yersinia enterocolitica W22703 TaxID=913028 RepID=F4N2W6_YEREN|nr:hypothetical protein FORC065_3921 [Yersinia enterocolitica]UXD27777.1 hypothetical protein FORC066_0557 [Yersinia enterocolitica]CBX72424.1 unknown protein [Yersinia enterocolitica W22703]CCO70063.1 hypothetical protein D322_3206 [Yersinia enterocolitica IP 10393]
MQQLCGNITMVAVDRRIVADSIRVCQWDKVADCAILP